MSTDPRTYDYSKADRSCDIVMKGGITSGVVYPHAVCELAQTYRFRSVGGTSAGAIAAAGAAAAEYGREGGGFQRLAALPMWIGTGTNLRSLFQPQRRTTPLFNVLVTAVSRARAKPLRIAASAIWNFRLAALIGAAPGLALVVAAALRTSGWLLLLAVICGVLLLLLGMVFALGFAVVRRLTRDVADNSFGICSGFSPPGTEPKALTPWLADVIDSLAGAPEPIPNDHPPLTFGDLWRGPASLSSADGTPQIRLEMMTTNLVNRRPERLPWETAEFFFDPDQLRTLFPERVVRWLLDHPPPEPAQPAAVRDSRLRCALLEPLRPLPAAADLPVIVATRLSLSFPVLLSAIPLWKVDVSRTAYQDAWKEWVAWARTTEDWERQLAGPAKRAELEARHGRLEPEICWFSDGGISSNFPIHFFDSPLPRWPTFAVNLRPFHPDHLRNDVDESQNVWMPDTNAGGILEWWYRFPEKAGRRALLDKRLPAFGNAVVRTMQNRSDEAQMRMPGYRDRVVHIGHTADEGGMNLTMAPTDILRLTDRGRLAGARLVARFARPPQRPSSLGWANHRWVRYRASMSAVEQLLRKIGRGYSLPPEHPGDPPYDLLIARGPDDAPSSYRWARAAQQQFAEEATRRLVDVDAWAHSSGQAFEEGSPNPAPEVRIVPRT